MPSTPKNTRIGDVIHFADHPEFTPNLTPEQIFRLGSFGGTYWRPIYSSVTKRNYKNQHKEFKWSQNINEEYLTSPHCDKTKNKYGVTSGTSLEYWESNDWMAPQDPYGWVQWYCRFYEGRRTRDDARQISRWLAFAGPNGRFRKRLIGMCRTQKRAYNDITVSPVIRQGLQHWAYVLTRRDFER